MKLSYCFFIQGKSMNYNENWSYSYSDNESGHWKSIFNLSSYSFYNCKLIFLHIVITKLFKLLSLLYLILIYILVTYLLVKLWNILNFYELIWHPQKLLNVCFLCKTYRVSPIKGERKYFLWEIIQFLNRIVLYM